MAEISQDLLLAALGVLTDTVPQETLRTTLHIWAEKPDHSLAELLKEQGTLDESQLQALLCLVRTHLSNHNGDVRSSLEAWNAEAITLDMLTEIENQVPGSTLGATLAQSLAPTVMANSSGGVEPSVSPELPNFTQDQRFELLRKHARGGIGQVWLARDRELQREVAVKEIQPRFVDREDQRKRFLLEAEITGNLEHPGIVPVYSLGRNAEGRPFYAMRFIRGESLSEAIKRFHAGLKGKTSRKERRPGMTWGIEFQQLLRRFLDVCDAMEYAHSRGVIHRDLKPANIMLGQYGETLVVDWGLAKIVGKSDIVPIHGEVLGDGEFVGADAAVATAIISGETQPGTTIGTPSYMSPEQARGALEELGPPSDVYSLGATLYELLTGAFPFAAEGANAIIAKVKKGELTAPRSLVPNLPAPLEAICLKAMAFAPAQRYQTARELALDLEHWMADEPVTAYPEKWLQKLSRWMRRHRSWTYAGAVALLVITLGATVSLFVLDGARRRTDAALSQAEANFKMAQEAVDKYLTNVSENTLLKEQETTDIRKLRKDLLSSALPYYESFVRYRGTDPALRQQLANAYFRLGEITREIDKSEDAITFYRKALDLWEPLAKAEPNDLKIHSELAACYLAVGKIRLSQTNHEEALNWLDGALQIYRMITDRKPNEPQFQARIAECRSQIGLCYSDAKQPELALDALNQGRVIQERLVGHYPDNIDYKKSLAEIVNWMGFLDYSDAGLCRGAEDLRGIPDDLPEISWAASRWGPSRSDPGVAGQELSQHRCHVPCTEEVPTLARGLPAGGDDLVEARQPPALCARLSGGTWQSLCVEGVRATRTPPPRRCSRLRSRRGWRFSIR